MFFKRLTKNKPANNAPTAEATPDAATAQPAEMPAVQPLASDKLRRIVDGKSLGFKTTTDLKPAAGPIGQERALGKDSASEWSPSVLTTLTENAARRNNEMEPGEVGA